MPLHELHAEPDLHEPVLVVALEGWIDAGGAAARAVETIVGQVDTELVATFDADSLLDFRARRPTMHLVDGVNTGLTWAATELHALRSPGGTDVLLLTGAEPDHAWLAFRDDVCGLALRLGVRMEVGIGAYPAGVPHTRPVQISATASDDALAASLGFIRGTIDVPAGVEAAIEQGLTEAGLPAVGIWAQVPHYVSAMRYPAASMRLVEACNQVAGTDFSTDELVDEVREMRDRIDALVSGNPQHLDMVRQLEESYDAEATPNPGLDPADLPSGDDLAEELQRFLREQGD